MKAETKFNIGDKVFYINNYRVVCSEISKIEITIDINTTNVSVLYTIKNTNATRQESLLFATKQELLNSL